MTDQEIALKNAQADANNLLRTQGSQTITPTQIQPQAPINIASTFQQPTDMGTGLVASGDMIQQDIQKYLDAANQPQTETQSLYDQLIGSVSTASEGLTGRGASQTQAEQQTGFTQANKELADLNAQYLSKKAEYDKLNANIEATAGGKGLTTSMMLGQQGAVNRAAAADLGLLQAQILGKQGQVEAAQSAANRAVDLMYQDREAVYNTKLKQLELIKDKLTGEESKRAKALEYALNKEQKALDEEKQVKKDIQALALKIGGFGADSNTITKVANAKDYNEALTFAGSYLQDPKDSLDMQLTKAQIAKTWSDAKKVDTVSGTLSDADIKRIDTSPQGKKLISLSGLYQKSQTYQNLVNQYGFKATGNAKALLDSAYADLKIAYKEAANLGALTGPDVSIIEEAIKPTSGGAAKYLSYKLSGGQGGVSGAIEQSLSKARTEALNNYKQLTSRNSNYANSEYTRSLISPFAKQYATVNIDTVPKGEIIETEDGILLESLGGGQFSPL